MHESNHLSPGLTTTDATPGFRNRALRPADRFRQRPVGGSRYPTPRSSNAGNGRRSRDKRRHSGRPTYCCRRHWLPDSRPRVVLVRQTARRARSRMALQDVAVSGPVCSSDRGDVLESRPVVAVVGKVRSGAFDRIGGYGWYIQDVAFDFSPARRNGRVPVRDGRGAAGLAVSGLDHKHPRRNCPCGEVGGADDHRSDSGSICSCDGGAAGRLSGNCAWIGSLSPSSAER